MFTDDCNWDTPEHVKALNETIFKLRPEKYTSTKKKSYVHSDTQKRSSANVVSNTKADSCVKPFKVQEDISVVPAVVTLGSRKPSENDVYENHCSEEYVKKKKKKCKSKHYMSSGNGDGTCGAKTLDHCSSTVVPTPNVKLKSDAKYVKTAKTCLKPGRSNNTTNLTLLPADSSSVCEALSVNSTVSSKRRKRKRHTAEEDESTVKPNKRRTVDSKSDAVCADTDECSVGLNKCNFNIVQLRSALQQYRRFSDAVSKQDKLYDKASSSRTLQMDQKSAVTIAQREKVDTDISETNRPNSCLPSEVASAGGSSGMLKERMINRLSSARFRFINEQMYRSTGSEAAEMFARDKDAFTVYHAGFQAQLTKWPTNPVDRVIDYINNSGRLTVVVDFGCGDAKIARSVPNVVHSYDLVALNEHVTACDMAHVPLKKCSVDIAVFCLSLMGTNILQYLAEASRVLKLGGVLLIAEVVSRFQKIGSFVRKLHKLGFELENKVVNKMFVWFEMKKICALPAEDSMPSIELYPCVYKKR